MCRPSYGESRHDAGRLPDPRSSPRDTLESPSTLFIALDERGARCSTSTPTGTALQGQLDIIRRQFHRRVERPLSAACVRATMPDTTGREPAAKPSSSCRPRPSDVPGESVGFHVKTQQVSSHPHSDSAVSIARLAGPGHMHSRGAAACKELRHIGAGAIGSPRQRASRQPRCEPDGGADTVDVEARVGIEPAYTALQAAA